MSVGGKGGAGGVGGQVAITNNGAVGTFGAQSDGIFAQSIGGGGGSAGAATSTSGASDDSQIQTAIGVGGSGGAAGNGGPVTIVNGVGGTVSTEGVDAVAIVGQSVGGGGGSGAMAGVVSGSLKSLSIGVGGNGGGAGNGGTVSITTGDGTSDSTINTMGKQAIGILAQSIGGGGRLATSMTTDQTFDPAQLFENPQGRIADIQGFSLTLGGENGSTGDGGEVDVTTNGGIGTQGLGAHAILAQSIGGGGGMVIGGQLTLPAGGTGGPGGAGGNGGPVNIKLQAGTVIETAGDGAFGVIAQSIGGGGGFAGDPSAVQSYQTGTGFGIKSNTGNGGAVTVTATNASIATTGKYAPAIFAQSVGGGGGFENYSVSGGVQKVEARGTAGGVGAGGSVAISLVGTDVVAPNTGSAGILAQSDGQSSGTIQISLDANSRVVGGLPDPAIAGSTRQHDAAAIRLLGGTGNQIVNAGTISGYVTGTGIAILADGSASNTTVTNTGTISGDIYLGGSGASSLTNLVGGKLAVPSAIDLVGGLLTNSGTFYVGGAGTVGRTTLTGNLLQSGTGTLVVDIGSAGSTGDSLMVNGTAVLGGKIEPVIDGATSLKPGSRTISNVVVATGGLTLAGSQLVLSTPALSYGLSSPDSHSLDLGYSVDYAGAQALRAAGLSSPNRLEVGRALNAILLTGDPGELGPFAARLLGVQTAQAYAATLDSVSADTVADVQQTVFEAQQAFSTTVLHQILNESRAGGAGFASYATAGLTPTAGPRVNAQGMRAWVAGFGGSDVLSGTEQQGTLHAQIAGGMLGIDKWFGAERMAGIAVGGGTTNFSVPDRSGEGTITSFNLGAYGLQRFGHAYVAGLLDYGNFSGDTQRFGLGGATGLAGTARTSVTGNLLGGRLEAGWEAAVGRVTLTPFAALEVDHLWQAPLTGTPGTGPGSSNLALSFDSQQETSVPLTLGLRAARDFQLAGHVLNLSGELGWVHEFNPQRQLTAAFVVAPGVPFRILGVSASSNSALTGLNARLSLSHNIAMFANFTGRFSGVETAVGGFGGLQVTW